MAQDFPLLPPVAVSLAYIATQAYDDGLGTSVAALATAGGVAVAVCLLLAKRRRTSRSEPSDRLSRPETTGSCSDGEHDRAAGR